MIPELQENPPAGQNIAFQHIQHGEHGYEEQCETQRLHGELEIAAIAREDVHPAAQYQQQRHQHQEYSQDQHEQIVMQDLCGLQLQPQERGSFFHAVEGDELPGLFIGEQFAQQGVV